MKDTDFIPFKIRNCGFLFWVSLAKFPFRLGSRTSHMMLALHCVWNVLAHAQKPDFVFRRNGRVHLNQRGRQFSRLLAADVCASAVVMLDTPCSEVVWRVLATYSIRQFSLHSPPPLCVTVCHHVSTGLYEGRPRNCNGFTAFGKHVITRLKVHKTLNTQEPQTDRRWTALVIGKLQNWFRIWKSRNLK